MKLQNLTVIFIIIIIPIILIISLYITTGLKTIKYQSLYDEGLLNATHDAVYAFELNTANDELSENPEIKRSIIKASINMFERSLCNTCGISAYNAKDIEEYIPAIVFGMYDGFYMYAPSVRYNGTTKEYNHNLKNYVYYSEKLDDNGTTIIYSLDNYVVISGVFNGKYQTKEGYLIDLTDTNVNGEKYKGITINKETIDVIENTDAINYYKEAYKFTEWFNENIGNNIKDENNKKYLYIDEDNNPEDENSLFVQHKRKIIKNKIESVLNSSITAYSERTWNKVYKMPKLTVEDWEKIYSNISMITFFQGKSIGLTKYNGYCVLNSTNNKEYVNPNLMYFIDNEGYYHDIRCEKCVEATTLTGYKVGNFAKKKVQTTDGEGKTTTNYIYDHNELACYYCVNGQINALKSIQEYVSDTEEVKTAYWTSLARERYNTSKLLKEEGDKHIDKKNIKLTVKFEDDNNTLNLRPNDIELKLKKNVNGTINTIENINVNGNIEKEWDDMPQKEDTGESITYFIEDYDLSNEFYDVVYQDLNYNFTITYKLKVKKFAGNGNYYYTSNDDLSWQDAKVKCEDLEGHLVTITSQEEQNFIEGILLNGRTYSLGAYVTAEDDDDNTKDDENDGDKCGTWSWITGEPFTYYNWGRGNPDNGWNNQDIPVITTGGDSGKSMLYDRKGECIDSENEYEISKYQWDDREDIAYGNKVERYYICEWER